jgi:hypothetical protein
MLSESDTIVRRVGRSLTSDLPTIAYHWPYHPTTAERDWEARP